MTDYKRFGMMMMLAGMILISGCTTSTDPDIIEPEPEPPPREPEPVERVGDREWTLTIIDRADETELTGFDITIDGPVSVNEEGVATAQFVVEGLLSGEYTVTITLDGYLESEITESFEVPEDESADFFAESTVSLRELTPPVQIRNDEDTTVQTGKPDDEDAEEEEAVTLQIPANTFPPEAQNEDGSVSISVTRSRPSQATSSDEGTVAESLDLRPAATLNNPVTVTIPIREIEGLQGVEYVLQPGNIPVTQDASGNLTFSLTPDLPSITGRSILDEFRRFTLVSTNVTIVPSPGQSPSRSLGSGECGAAVSETYSVDGVDIPLALRNFDASLSGGGFSRQVNVAAVPERILRVSARHLTMTYDLRVNGSTVATVTVPVNQVFTEVTQIACHNSGGN